MLEHECVNMFFLPTQDSAVHLPLLAKEGCGEMEL